jgi:hypothetical protein
MTLEVAIPQTDLRRRVVDCPAVASRESAAGTQLPPIAFAGRSLRTLLLHPAPKMSPPADDFQGPYHYAAECNGAARPLMCVMLRFELHGLGPYATSF